MIHTNNPIIKHKAGLLNLAEELGNVSKACKVMSVSRDTFYCPVWPLMFKGLNFLTHSEQ